MAEYYATVQYQEGTQLDHAELNDLRSFADLNQGNPYEIATNAEARFIAFSFRQEEDATRFAETSKNLEKIVAVKVGKLR